MRISSEAPALVLKHASGDDGCADGAKGPLCPLRDVALEILDMAREGLIDQKEAVKRNRLVSLAARSFVVLSHER